jgi:hypothetical protein
VHITTIWIEAGNAAVAAVIDLLGYFSRVHGGHGLEIQSSLSTKARSPAPPQQLGLGLVPLKRSSNVL